MLKVYFISPILKENFKAKPDLTFSLNTNEL